MAIGTPVVDVDRVLVDNREGGRKVARYLAELGHRDLALISGPAALASSRERYEGMKEVLDSVGARLIVHHGRPDRDEGYRAAGELLSRHPELTAILGSADQMAIGALACLRDAGRSVPGDVSVAGFNDIAISRDLVPALTTVRLPLREMGALALEMALVGQDGEERRPEERKLGVELVVRDSTGQVRRAR